MYNIVWVVSTAGNLRHRGARSLVSLAQLRSNFKMNTQFHEKIKVCSKDRTGGHMLHELASDHSAAQAMLELRNRFIINCLFLEVRRSKLDAAFETSWRFTRYLLVEVSFPSQIDSGDWGTFTQWKASNYLLWGQLVSDISIIYSNVAYDNLSTLDHLCTSYFVCTIVVDRNQHLSHKRGNTGIDTVIDNEYTEEYN